MRLTGLKKKHQEVLAVDARECLHGSNLVNQGSPGLRVIVREWFTVAKCNAEGFDLAYGFFFSLTFFVWSALIVIVSGYFFPIAVDAFN